MQHTIFQGFLPLHVRIVLIFEKKKKEEEKTQDKKKKNRKERKKQTNKKEKKKKKETNKQTNKKEHQRKIRYFYLYLKSEGRVFANGQEDLGSIPGHVIPKTFKVVLDTSLLNTQQY